MEELKIPARSFAVAAAESSALFGCRPEFVYAVDSHASARARTVAVAAMVTVFPKVKRIAIAQGFNLKVEQSQMAVMVSQARRQDWWSERRVVGVAEAIKEDLRKNPGPPHVEFDAYGNIEFVWEEPAPDLKEPEPEIVAEQYTPRRWRPARIIMPNASRSPKGLISRLNSRKWR